MTRLAAQAIIALARVARDAGCNCGWGGQHRDDCPVGQYQEAVSDPSLMLQLLDPTGEQS